eukprot:TRINITY_DN76_c0_g1_i1.p1 TRINITY_DN76_c0_g1~~TRINITY_DN76_c0_g1_i1.p1  ORF type:complete len:716 (-),score=252.57 TRINITY_DN76_c0_g1_i1:101-2248(-)
MAMMRKVLLISALAGVEAVPPANPKQSNAVNKVMKMLTDLAAKVEDEGVKETKTYGKFARFCTEAAEERDQAINDGKTMVTELKALIDKKNSRIGTESLNIEKLTEEINTLTTEIEEATATRKSERTSYEKSDAEITAAIKALDRAVEGLQNSKKGPGPMLLQQSNDLKTAVLLADSMGLDSSGASSLLNSGNAAPTVDYEFHSGGIIATLEKLQEDFRSAKTSSSQEEITARGAHTMTIQEKQQSIDRKTRQRQSAQSAHDAATQAMGNAQKKLEVTQKTLGEDQTYASELNIMCTGKKKTFDERADVRANELNALKSAIDIMSEGMKPVGSFVQKAHPVSLNLVHAASLSVPVIQAAEAAAEAVEHKAAPPAKKVAFLQQREASLERNQKEIRNQIVSFLRSRSAALKSPALLSLARHASKNDNLKAVRDMLQGMIDRLNQQDADATDHKQFCDTSLAENAEKRDEAASLVAKYNAKMATGQAERDTLKEEISVLEKQIADLEKNQEDTTKIRDEEKAENKAAIADAKDGKAATEQAIDVLKGFYAANAPVMLQHKQPPTGPMADAPDASFKNGETNHGSQAEATGVMGMMEVILADMERTIEDTTKEEQKASTEHDQFMTETNTDKDQKNSDVSQKSTEVAGLETDIAGDESSLTTQLLALTNTLNEAADLDASCNVKANYQERIEKREKEMEEIKKAIDFFNDPTKTLALR